MSSEYIIKELPIWWEYRHCSPGMLRRLPQLETTARQISYEEIEQSLSKGSDRELKQVSDLDRL